VISIAPVRRSFRAGTRHFTLDVPTLDIVEGELTFLVGPNGSGKSLYLRSLAADAIEGAEPFSPRVAQNKKTIKPQLVMQQPDLNLAVSLTVGENYALWVPRSSFLRYFLPLRRSRTVIKDVGSVSQLIDRAWTQQVSTLSGGQKQSLVLACRFLAQPGILLLDEVTASIDEIAKSEVLDLLCTEVKRNRTGCIIVTHEFDQVAKYADRLLIIANGSICLDMRLEKDGRRMNSEALREEIAKVWFA